MKKIIYLIVLTLFAGTFLSCDKDGTDIFKETPSVRRNQAISEYFDVLCSADQGWIFEYFPHEKQRYGGYNFLLKFDEDLSVTAEFDKYKLSNTYKNGSVLNMTGFQTSSYNVMFNFSVMLSFDTFNPYLHYFSEGIMVSAWYQGCKGDYEFMLMGHENGIVKTKGNRNQNYLYMYKFTPTAEIPDWDAYLTAVAATDALVPTGENLSLLVDGEKIADLAFPIYVAGGPIIGGRCWTATYEVQTGTNPEGEPIMKRYQNEDVIISYISRPDGIYLYDDTTIPGTGITLTKSFAFNSDKTALVGKTDKGKTVEIKIYIP